ncbi:MAG: hypothetical protein GC204_07440 [Chloroflexi bacterium]|nr:hypothetical protein [Chloroflexota bacterium]
MSNSLILYLGTPQAGQALAALAEQRNDYVYLPENLMQTLGMYITYFPHVTILDMSVADAQEAFVHLRSVEASPMILLTDQPVHDPAIRALPLNASAEAVLEALDRLRIEQPESVSNGLLHYA